MEKILLFNPSISSINKGDDVIAECCKQAVLGIFGNAYYVDISTHLPVSNLYLSNFANAKLRFVLGSNLLQSKMNARFRQWDVTMLTASSVGPAVLLGVGWRNYSDPPNFYTKMLYNRLLSRQYLHSVRDSYAQQKLNEIGFDNVVNTGCPTMWPLTPEHCAKIPSGKGRSVICTLTDYMRDVENDRKMLDILADSYEETYLWLQGADDYDYLKALQPRHMPQIVPPTLQSYDAVLESIDDLDYVGTRLHGGIRAMQKGRRSIIIAIDVRAIELSRDYNIPIIRRTELDGLKEMIVSSFETKIRLPQENIDKWIGQFKS